MNSKELSKAEVLKRLRGLTGDKRKTVLCALVGHSRLTTFCFGYLNCGRCGAQVGDTLAGAKRDGLVVERHGSIEAKGCDCREVAETLTWRDTMMVATTPSEWLKSGKRS